MNIFKLLLITATLSTGVIFGLSVGRDGEPQILNDQKWQKVQYEDANHGFKAELPGEPHSGLVNQYIYSASDENGSHYEIYTEMQAYEDLPQNQEELAPLIEQEYGEIATITFLDPGLNNARLAVQIDFHDQSTRVRLLTSEKKIYYAVVKGEDFSLSNHFFDSIQIKE